MNRFRFVAQLPGRIAIVASLVALTACSAPLVKPPLTLPPADGRIERVSIGDGYAYAVNYQALDQSREGVFLRVTRDSAPEMDYSEGLAAKRAAEAYCATYRRKLNPVAYGVFSTPASWLFEGGCT
ncbi:MAG: hypothetical protein ABI832_19860 [bacterium]